MNKTFVSILISLLFLSVSSQRKKCQKVNYTFSLLTLTWPPQFCNDLQEKGRSCVSNWQSIWDGSSMTIHGYWPSSTNTAYMSCFKQYGYDPYCHADFPFEQSLFNSQQLKELNKYWPAIGPNQDFWDYQWDKHGTCYLKLVRDQDKSQLTDGQVEHKYFMSTVEKTKKLNIRLHSGKVNSKEKFAQMIGLKQPQFLPICGNTNALRELRICYGISSTPGDEHLINCPASNDPSICKFPIIIGEYITSFEFDEEI